MTETREELKENLRRQHSYLTAPTRKIDFQVDTLPNPTKVAAYFSSSVNTVTENYIEGRDNSFNQSLSTLAHEQKHRDNHNNGLKNLPMSAEEYYKVCCLDEISATICECLQVRQEYLSAKTPAEKEKIINDNPKFDYYFSAIKAGTINPESTSSKDFNKEMQYIATETQKMWMNTFSQRYDENHTPMTEYFVQTHSYEKLAPNPKNYEKARQIAFNIGGIDFSQYLEDIPCINENIKEADKAIQTKQPSENVIALMYDIYPPMSLEQCAKLNWYKKISTNLNDYLDARQKYFDGTLTEDDVYGRLLLDSRYKIGSKNQLSDAEKEWLKKKYNAAERPNVDLVNKHYQHYGNNAVYNQKNYDIERQKYLNIRGFNFSFIDPKIFSPQIKRADEQIANGTAPKDLTIINPLREISLPLQMPDKSLSPSQQFEIARQRMFIETIIARYPCLPDLINATEATEALCKILQEEINKDPELKQKWQQREQELAEIIAKENQTKLDISPASDEKYNEELAKIYQFDNFNIKDFSTLNVSDYMPQNTTPEAIETIKGIKKASFTERLKNNISKKWNNTKQKIKNTLNKIKEKAEKTRMSIRNLLGINNYYIGDPKYRTWSKDNRVSDIQYATIYDFSKPFLKETLDALTLAETRTNNKNNMKKFNTAVDKRQQANANTNVTHQTQTNHTAMRAKLLPRQER